MVKFRGIDVSIVSQFDIQKLPEFCIPASMQRCNFLLPSAGPAEDDPFTSMPPLDGPKSSLRNAATAACFIPVYPGSQIWLEYSISPPHPSNATYFFKLLHNGHLVTSWDCTEKHGYFGKMCYPLELVGEAQVRRRGLRFSSGRTLDEEAKLGLAVGDDCLEVRMYRVEGRQRISIDEVGQQALKAYASNTGLCFVNVGFLDQGCPTRRYRYQLLDPTDEPFVTFRFYYRSYAFLQDHSIVQSLPSQTPSSAISSPNWYQSSAENQFSRDFTANVTDRENSPSFAKQEITILPNAEVNEPPHVGPDSHHSQDRQTEFDESPGKHGEVRQKPVTKEDSEDSLRLKTKDSIEDLHNNVPRSPRTSNKPIPLSPGKTKSEIPPSPTRASNGSPFQLLESQTKLRKKGRQKEKVIAGLGGVTLELKKERPSSPATKSNMIRKIIGGMSSSSQELRERLQGLDTLFQLQPR